VALHGQKGYTDKEERDQFIDDTSFELNWFNIVL